MSREEYFEEKQMIKYIIKDVQLLLDQIII